MQTFDIAYFAGLSGKQPRQTALTWEELRVILTSPHRPFLIAGIEDEQRGSKEWRDAIKAARYSYTLFSPTLYKQGATRAADGVESLSCFVADLDDITPDDFATLRLRWKGLAWALYTSSSHLPESPRVRVVFPLASPVPAEDWLHVWANLRHHLTDGHCDKSTKNADRIQYLPIVPVGMEDSAFAEYGEGEFLDPDAYEMPPHYQRVADIIDNGRPVGASGGASQSREDNANDPGGHFNISATPGVILDLLVAHGWTEHSRRGSAIYVTRPGKEVAAGASGVVGFPTDDTALFHCFTSSAPGLEADKTYKPFGLLGILNHHGDFTSAASALKDQGYGAAITEVNKPRKGGAEEKARRISLVALNQTDAGNAERIILHHAENIRWTPALDFRVWNGKHWESDDTAIMRCARETVRTLYAEANSLFVAADKIADESKKKTATEDAAKLKLFAIKSESTKSLQNMIQQVNTFVEVAARDDQFNLKAWIVPFQNGVWDRGEWREHRRDDYTEILLPGLYCRDADRSEWLALLTRMTGGDDLFAKTLQDVAGYCLSGASTLRTIPWAYGPTGSGKSTFAEMIQTVLGSSAEVLDKSLLTGDRDTERLGAAVRGKRALFLGEAGHNKISAEILKMLSGSDPIPGRYLYAKHTFSAKPSWVLLAVSNDPPSVNAHDNALKDRVSALPFLHSLKKDGEIKFSDGTRIEEVRRNINNDLLLGFTSWAVDGLENVYRNQSVYLSPNVLNHTRKFWLETDPVSPFWQTVERKTLEDGIEMTLLHRNYVMWCDSEGIRRPLQGKNWGAACRSAGLEDAVERRKIDGQSKTVRVWRCAFGTMPFNTDNDNF